MTRSGRGAAGRSAERRLSILQLAEVLGNVAEACRQSGTDRRSFYRWRRRFQAFGLAGLRDATHERTSRLDVSSPRLAAELQRLSLAHPSWGCGSLARALAELGFSISSPTVQRLLIARGLGTLAQRAARLEEAALAGGLALSEEQRRAVEALNPAFRLGDAGRLHPGQLLVQDTLLLAQAPLLGPLYLQAAVDASCGLAFGLLHTRRSARAAQALIETRVLPFYREQGVRVGAIRTSAGSAYRGSQCHPYGRLLESHGIAHRTSGAAAEKGILLRFAHAAVEEFWRAETQASLQGPLAALEGRFAAWLADFNQHRAWVGYPNRGLPPLEMFRRRSADAGRQHEAGGAEDAPPPR